MPPGTRVTRVTHCALAIEVEKASMKGGPTEKGNLNRNPKINSNVVGLGEHAPCD